MIDRSESGQTGTSWQTGNRVLGAFSWCVLSRGLSRTRHIREKQRQKHSHRDGRSGVKIVKNLFYSLQNIFADQGEECKKLSGKEAVVVSKAKQESPTILTTFECVRCISCQVSEVLIIDLYNL